MEVFISLLSMLAGLAGVTVQVLILRDWMQIDKYLKEQDMQRIKKIEEEEDERAKEIAQCEIPDWAEEFIDRYLADSEKDNCQ